MFEDTEDISPIYRMPQSNEKQKFNVLDKSKPTENKSEPLVTADMFKNIIVSDSMEVDEVLDKAPLADIQNYTKPRMDDADRRAEKKTMEALEQVCRKAQSATEYMR
jgi:hypothetical protein